MEAYKVLNLQFIEGVLLFSLPCFHTPGATGYPNIFSLAMVHPPAGSLKQAALAKRFGDNMIVS